MFKKATLSLLVVLFSSSLGMAQIVTDSANAGYVIVTPLGSTVAAFTAVETLFNSMDIGVAQASVGPAPFLTTAVLPVNTGLTGGAGSTLSFVNPSLNAATVNLTFSDSFGAQISSRTISVPGKSQILFSVNDLLGTVATPGTGGLLLRITSNIPVAIQALDFRGVGFTSIPITNVAAAATTPTIGTFTATPTVTTVGFIGVAPTVPIGMPICIAPTVVAPSTITVGAPATTGQFTSGVVTTTVASNSGAFIFPDVVRAEGSSTRITVGNLSKTTTQSVRFDFFTSSGEFIRSISNVAISPQGFVVFSSEFDGIIVPQ